MDTILRENRFIQDTNPNIWIRNDWTIRLEGETIEIFNDPDKMPGKYYYGPIGKIDLEQIIKDIDYFENLK